MNTTPVRINIRFFGKKAGSLGICHNHNTCRTVNLPWPPTEEQMKEAARVALYEKDDNGTAYEKVTVFAVAFN